jgi:hypothetical protein
VREIHAHPHDRNDTSFHIYLDRNVDFVPNIIGIKSKWKRTFEEPKFRRDDNIKKDVIEKGCERVNLI